MRARTILIVVVTLVCSGCWAQFRGDPARTGNQPFEFTIGPANVSTLTEVWHGSLSGSPSSPSIASDRVFVGSTDHRLYAFDAAGATNCASGLCAPVWTATTGQEIHSSPAVAGGVVFVGSSDHRLYAFDATGATNCSGSPVVCAPLWTAMTDGAIDSSPAVADGVVYVGNSAGRLLAFDTAGTANCSGTPKTCAPLWTTTVAAGFEVASSPAVSAHVVYATSAGGTVAAYDATGTTNCTGAPKTCAPLWAATIGSSLEGSPAVANGVVYVPSKGDGLFAFDASGRRNCAGSPKTCTPLWTAAGNTASSPAVANGRVYLGGSDGIVRVFDAAGVDGCSGVPTVCTPRWTAPTNGAIVASPAVANGVVYVGSADGHLYAFGAAGSTNCSGAPLVCAPLWAADTSAGSSSPAVVNGTVFLAGADRLGAYRPCTNPVSGVGWGPCDIQNAYRLPAVVGGSGMTVAIVDANHDPNAEQDLATYRSTFGLPPCTQASGCFRQVNQLGQTTGYPPADVGWSVEISLDLQMVSAACPQCKILLVEAPNSLSAIGTAEDTAVALGANAVSNSYGTNEVAGLAAFDSHYSHAGVPIVVSSGDLGYAAGPQYPAVIPSVTAVGGTTLTHSGIGRGWSETVWNRSATALAGSGCAHFEVKPAWQTDIGCVNRTVADVAAVADHLAIYDTYGTPGWISVGGTSASAPLVAAMYALAHGTAGAADLYAHPGLLFDVVSGSNGTCGGSYLCTGVAGFDGPTGLGTPCGVGAFGTAIASPAGCGGAASQPLALLAPSLLGPMAADFAPACRAAPAAGVRCFARFG